MLVTDMLEDLGCEIAAVASSLHEGQAHARTSEFDLALVDLNLAGEQSGPIAEALIERSIPFLFVTGYGAAGLPDHLQGTPTLTKPFDFGDLQKAVEAAFSAT